ncbi:phage tail fiber protein [Candidatus Termititenax aidoneus]|uniref:Phage tail fiber protein n=1 Tax=Termititenax aidoneus TaxID=2218524 RepID=A0A388TB45_TERA1|nr:phage tail fiber protein [Candidatus Termititenax aidoneus]
MTIATGERMYAEDILNLTFFPVGAILIFSGAAYSSASANFKTIWKVCDGTNNTPNLVGRFLRGGTSSDFITGGGADSQNVTITTAHLPAHSHGVGTLAMPPLSVSELPVSGMAASGFSISGQAISGLTIDNAGAHSHTVSGNAVEAGSHGHTFSNGSAASAGGHTHTVTVHDSNHTLTPAGSSDYGAGEYGEYHSATYTTSSDGTHTHTVSGDIANGGAHTHTISGSAAEGGTHTHTVNSSNAAISGGTITGSIAGGTVSGSIIAGDSGITGSTGSAGSGSAFSVSTVPAYYTVIYIMKIA